MMMNEIMISSAAVLPRMLVARMMTVSDCVVIGISCVIVVTAPLVVGAGVSD